MKGTMIIKEILACVRGRRLTLWADKKDPCAFPARLF